MKYDRLVLITRQTELEALVERFQTLSQAEFYLTQAGHDFGSIRASHERYTAALSAVRRCMPSGLKLHVIERRALPQYRFETSSIVITLGQDGLVANTAKYLDGQPLIAINPDPGAIEGILLPVKVEAFEGVLDRTINEDAEILEVTMAEARLSDGQVLRAVNDIYVGAATHVSSRYRIKLDAIEEEQSSSGLIVSTGVGSTGWLRSIYAGAMAVMRQLNPDAEPITAPEAMTWDCNSLAFNVREPWPSVTTGADLVSGMIDDEQCLEIISRMPAGGVVFGDGVQADYLEFNAGVTAEIGVSDRWLNLVLR